MADKRKTERNPLIQTLDAAAKSYPMKNLAKELGKADSSLRNELTEIRGYKLGLLDAIRIMAKTGELRPLKMIGAKFGLILYKKPEIDISSPASLTWCISNFSIVFGRIMKALGPVMKDGTATDDERRHCLEILDELITACIKIQAVLRNRVQRPCN